MSYGVKSRTWFTLSWLLALSLVMPVIVLLLNSLTGNSAVFSHLWQTVLPDYLFNTISLGLIVMVLATLFGVPAAVFVVKTNIIGRQYFRWLLLLPLAMPAYLIAYLYTGLFDYAGPIQTALRDYWGWSSPNDYWFFDIRSLGGAGVIIALSLFPYVYLLTRGALEQQDINVLRAARLLGLSTKHVIFKVAIPLARPAIALSLGLVLMETLADFATVQYFAINTLTTAIYDTWLGYGDLSGANRLASILMLLVFFVILWEQYSRRHIRHQSSRPKLQTDYYQLSRIGQIGAFGYCLALVVFGFILPLILLIDMAWRYQTKADFSTLFTSATNSFYIAVIVATLAVVISVILLLFKRLHRNKAKAWPERLAGLGYAVPGTVLAMAVLATFGPLDAVLNNIAAMLGFTKPGLILSGTIFAIIFAYLVRFTAIANNAINSGLSVIAQSVDYVPLSLGVTWRRMILSVHLPLLGRFIIIGWLLVFVEAMKELPAVLLLRPFNFDTLSTFIYQLISDERLEQGAIGAIFIVLFGLLPVILLNKNKG